MQIFSQAFNIIFDYGISAPGYGREFVHGMNAIDKRFIFHLMATVQLPGSQNFDTKKAMQTTTHNSDVSLKQEFQNHLSNKSHKHGIVDYGRKKKRPGKKVDK